MRITHLLILLLVVVLSASLALPAFAQDGAATYKTKCAMCHGPNGEGKSGPALKGTALTADQIVDLLTKGNDAKKVPHKKPMAGLPINNKESAIKPTGAAADAKAVADFVKSLK
jgi:mono/diheme cytochrome c family protein